MIIEIVQSNPQVGKLCCSGNEAGQRSHGKSQQGSQVITKVEDIDKLAYLAKAKNCADQEVIKRKTAEAEVASSAKERDQVRLDQRTMEADRATADKRRAQGNAAFAAAPDA
jgi:hypothetical protein